MPFDAIIKIFLVERSNASKRLQLGAQGDAGQTEAARNYTGIALLDWQAYIDVNLSAKQFKWQDRRKECSKDLWKEARFHETL